MKSLVLPSGDFWDFRVTKGGFMTRAGGYSGLWKLLPYLRKYLIVTFRCSCGTDQAALKGLVWTLTIFVVAAQAFNKHIINWANQINSK